MVFISDECVNMRGSSSLWIFPRDGLDYCPLVLKVKEADWGPKLFCFNNH